MNAREAMEALLEGKTLVEKFPKWTAKYIRMKGDRIEYKRIGEKWRDIEDIPLICLDFTHIQEEGE